MSCMASLVNCAKPGCSLQVSPDEVGRCDSSSYTSGSSSIASSELSDWPSQSCDSLGLRKRSPTFPSVREVCATPQVRQGVAEMLQPVTFISFWGHPPLLLPMPGVHSSLCCSLLFVGLDEQPGGLCMYYQYDRCGLQYRQPLGCGYHTSSSRGFAACRVLSTRQRRRAPGRVARAAMATLTRASASRWRPLCLTAPPQSAARSSSPHAVASPSSCATMAAFSWTDARAPSGLLHAQGFLHWHKLCILVGKDRC